MQVQVHSDNHIEGSARLATWVSTIVADRFDRFSEDLTRVVVHFHDDNAHKSGAADKRCQIEARPKGRQPLSVTHKAESLEFAFDGAVEKLIHALDHQMGKLRSKRGGVREDGDSSDNVDQLLEEDFLAEEQLRSA
ncbi:HPF/RaiA family ribosome-associated protein [Atopomonas sediminilitoris]|uniref:HPF/RaiA family ribosome-associated protein n=1 Tax=Atopomonas sediminilitoris TaxID=2919919 RepID=UPI001F4D6BBD|nr:HPF/RaiA family ribosome-associated protein [Atopomonas sediminilitoris]MCJ8169109.1 HPF/RaiA family ribosome-associated protein [Atopomonas sediminilitoris]